jgi:disulfide oxidoreductase YuzD
MVSMYSKEHEIVYINIFNNKTEMELCKYIKKNIDKIFNHLNCIGHSISIDDDDISVNKIIYNIKHKYNVTSFRELYVDENSEIIQEKLDEIIENIRKEIKKIPDNKLIYAFFTCSGRYCLRIQQIKYGNI